MILSGKISEGVVCGHEKGFCLELRKFQKLRSVKTRGERPKSAPYLRLKNIQGTTIGNIWKKYFSKRILNVKKMQGVPFDRIRKVA